MSWLKDFFTRNLGYKVVSLLFALTFWAWVQSEQRVEQRCRQRQYHHQDDGEDAEGDEARGIGGAPLVEHEVVVRARARGRVGRVRAVQEAMAREAAEVREGDLRPNSLRSWLTRYSAQMTRGCVR